MIDYRVFYFIYGFFNEPVRKKFTKLWKLKQMCATKTKQTQNLKLNHGDDTYNVHAPSTSQT